MADICDAEQALAKAQALNFPLSGSMVPFVTAEGKGPGDIRKHVWPFTKPGGMLLSLSVAGTKSHVAYTVLL